MSEILAGLFIAKGAWVHARGLVTPHLPQEHGHGPIIYHERSTRIQGSKKAWRIVEGTVDGGCRCSGGAFIGRMVSAEWVALAVLVVVPAACTYAFGIVGTPGPIDVTHGVSAGDSFSESAL